MDCSEWQGYSQKLGSSTKDNSLNSAPDNNQKKSADIGAEAIVSSNEQPTVDHKPTQPHKTRHTWLEKSAVAIAVLAFLAAAGQGWIARDTEKRQLRAYLAISSTNSVTYTPQKMDILIDNFGLTPAKNVRVFSSWEFLPFGQVLPNDFTFADKPGCGVMANQKNMQPGVSLIMPKNAIPASHDYCPDEYANLLKAERKELNAWLYGEIDYLDVFDEPHKTTFCGLYWPFEAVNINCDRHNEIDPKK
jgi:hypothetical protein